MKSMLYISLITCMVLSSGCATNKGPEYNGQTYNQIKTSELGTLQSVRPVVISDDGSGKFIGALIGAVLGSTVGGGKGTALTTLAGGLGGSYVGSKVNKANASELIIQLDDGREIVSVVKGEGYKVGDRVQVIQSYGKIEQIYILK